VGFLTSFIDNHLITSNFPYHQTIGGVSGHTRRSEFVNRDEFHFLPFSYQSSLSSSQFLYQTSVKFFSLLSRIPVPNGSWESFLSLGVISWVETAQRASLGAGQWRLYTVRRERLSNIVGIASSIIIEAAARRLA
jgi:hypothetical protein